MKGFRVWDKKEKKMYYDDFMIGTDGELYRLQGYTNLSNDKYIANMIPADVHRYIVMRQYDHYDKNGVVLYELDIIANDDGNKIILNDEEMISLHEDYDSYICIGNTFDVKKHTELNKGEG